VKLLRVRKLEAKLLEVHLEAHLEQLAVALAPAV